MADGPDPTAVRTALWRALHVELDPPPHVVVDLVGLKLAAPEEDWRSRGDMHPEATRSFRASIVARARFLDDLVLESATRGVRQYVVLGAGLDSFAQRHPDAGIDVFEIDQPGTQEWKRGRLAEEGYPIAQRFVPVDFERGRSWRDALQANGFDSSAPAVVSSTGVSVYLTREATEAIIRDVAALAPGSALAMTFMLPVELLDDVEGPMLAGVTARARASGTPFIGFYSPAEMVDMCRAAGFASASVVAPSELTERYFAARADGLRAPSAEQLVLARV